MRHNTNKANEVLTYGQIIKDIRNEGDNSRMQIVVLNNQTYVIVKRNGQFDDIASGEINTANPKNLFSSINKLYQSGSYQSGGGILKDGALAQYLYLEFQLFVA